MQLTASGIGTSRERGTPVVLRLLPHVHHPPARVLLPWPGEEARALDARGYRVSAYGAPPGEPGIVALDGTFLEATGGSFDLVCESGGFARLGPTDRAGYADAAARALRPGGILFGAFPAASTGALLTLLADAFDAARLEPSAFGGGQDWLEAVFVRR